MIDYLWLGLGILCAGIGGELFVRGAVGLARWLRLPAGIIGVTIAAFATSSPELAVSVSAALSGVSQIALGDALGSNVINISLILALALLISGLQTSFSQIKRDYLVALLTPLIIAVLAFDSQLSRSDGLILLAIFVGWLVLVIREARQHRQAAIPTATQAQGGLELLLGAAGLIFLVAAGYLIVNGAKGIAAAWGIDEFVIGATVVAVATGTPELATTLISKLRGHDELGLGNILGSNIFNGLFIVAVAALISPITITWSEVVIGLIFGVITTLVIFPFGRGWLGRWQAILLLLIYAIYNMAILQQ
jgi:cation:H+ antiporter